MVQFEVIEAHVGTGDKVLLTHFLEDKGQRQFTFEDVRRKTRLGLLSVEN